MTTKKLSTHFFSDSERPIGLQLFGTEPETFASSIQKISHYKPDFIDVNFGCPAKKIIKRGAGSALMRNLDDMAEIIRAIKMKQTYLFQQKFAAAGIPILPLRRPRF